MSRAYLPDDDFGPAVSVPVSAGRASVLVSPADHARVARHRWYANGSYFVRRVAVAGRTRRQSLGHYLLGCSVPRAKVRHRNGDRRDYRRGNLFIEAPGNVTYEPRWGLAKPWVARVAVDGRSYYLGHWPSESWAREICAFANPVAKDLRGRGLAREAIQGALDLAVGRDV